MGDYIKTQDELRDLRSQTLRSHIQYKWKAYNQSSSKEARDIVNSLETRLSELWDKRIPSMVSSYFADMEEILGNTYKVSNKDASMWIVVSTSAYGGIEIPVDNILAELGKICGWKLEGIHNLRHIRSASQHTLKLQEAQNVRLRESLIRLKKR